MSDHVKALLSVALCAALAGLSRLQAIDPQWQWVPLLAAVLVAAGAAYGITPPAQAAKMRAMRRKVDEMTADLGRAPSAVKPGVGTGPQRGCSTLEVLVGVAVAGIVVAVGIGVVGMFAGCGSLTPQTSTDVQLGVNAAACIITNGIADDVAGFSPSQTIADLVAKCGTSAAQIAQIFDAEAAAADRADAGTVAARLRALSAAAHSADGGK